MVKGQFQINSQHIRAIKGACGSTSNTLCTAATFNGTAPPPPFPTISFTITDMTPDTPSAQGQINYTINSITGVSLPYTYSNYNQSPVVLLNVIFTDNNASQPNYSEPSFLFPATLYTTTANPNVTLTSDLSYDLNNPTTLSQLTPGTYNVSLAYGQETYSLPTNQPYQYIAN
jgi:hypothetical protein